jgi:SOS response associated peptidase (SRAP)
MCGRYRLSRRKEIIAEHFDVLPDDDDWTPRYNIAPTQPVPIIRQHRRGTFELHGFIWQKDGPMLDLNEFVPLGSDLVITDGETINDRGDIAGSGMLPNGDFHAVVLIACSEAQPDDGCREPGEDVNVRTTELSSAQPRLATTRHKLSLKDVRRFVGNSVYVARSPRTISIHHIGRRATSYSAS